MLKAFLALLLACAVWQTAQANGGAAADPTAAALIADGNQRDDRGDHEGAIADYSQVIGSRATAGRISDPDTSWEARIDRSFSEASLGRYGDAFQDLDQAQALRPRDTTPLSARYWFDFDLDQFSAVVATIDALQKKTRADRYAPLLRYVALARLGKDGSSALARDVPQATRNRWPEAAAQMFLGQASPDQLLAWVENSDDEQAACEAPFYVGEYYLAHRDPASAQAAFQESERDPCQRVEEYYAARQELAVLQTSAQ